MRRLLLFGVVALVGCGLDASNPTAPTRVIEPVAATPAPPPAPAPVAPALTVRITAYPSMAWQYLEHYFVATPSASAPVTFWWTWGDGATSGPLSLPSARHAWTSPGDYGVSVTVEDAEGRRASTSRLIVVGPCYAEPAVCAR